MTAAHTDKQGSELIGQVIANRYRVESFVGQGAMGSVYKARHVKLGRAFAIKTLHPRMLQDPKLVQRFEREAELAGRLSHPNVVGVVDVGELPDGLRYMAMEFVEGKDLAVLLADAPMPAKRIIHIVRQLLEGLYHAHEHGLIHRDFKPENVIVERDVHGAELPRIVDFGIAILRDGDDGSEAGERLTTNGLVLGTPHYMAPEQAVGDKLDHRVDLFALGLIIYEMLCGKLPFDGNGAAVARANLMLEPPEIAVRAPGLAVDPLLEAFARKLMAKQRDARPATAKAARELLDLIERDRLAAAIALAGSTPSPPTAIGPGSTQAVAPLKAPAALGMAETVEAPVSVDMHILTDAPTENAPPIEAPRARRRGWLLGTIGLVVAGGATIVALRGIEPSAMQAAPPTPAPNAPAPTPPPAVPPAPAVEPAEAAVEPTPPPITEKSAPRTSRRTKVGPTTTASATAGSAAAASAVPTVQTPPPTPKPAVKPAEKPGPTTGLDKQAALRLYQSVGNELKALGDAGRDLFKSYTLISIFKEIETQEGRDAVTTRLAKIRKDAAARRTQ